MKKEKTFNLIGMVLGILVIIVGIVIIYTPAHSFSTDSVSRVTFGGDYYTEQYAATKAAVSNTAVTANNIRELGEKLALYCGLTFVIAGAVITLSYAKKAFCTGGEQATKEVESAAKSEAPPVAPVWQPIAEETGGAPSDPQE